MNNSRRLFLFIALGISALIAYIFIESFSQPGMERFEGKFEELDFFRNENNTGPVVRIYAIYALDTESTWMKEFGNVQPHTKYGKTKVFFFSEKPEEGIELSSQEPYFPAKWDKYLLATYEKSPMGEVKFSYHSK